MKGKRIWKRWICAVLALALLAAMPGGVSAAKTYTEVEWKYEDSLLVDVVVEESRSFTPEDFPGIDCKKVFVLKKNQAENGIQYQLVLQLDRWGDEELNEAIETVSQLPMVVQVQRNKENVCPDSILTLNHSYLYLAVGETADVFIEDLEINNTVYYNIPGIEFEPDPAYFDLNLLQKDSFQQFGISRFWPDIPGTGYLILLPFYQTEEQEGQKSETGYYYGLAGEDNQQLYEAMSSLAAEPGISYVSVYKDMLVSAMGEREIWTVANPEILTCVLSGGSSSEGESLNQTATIQGQKPGVTTLTCERYRGVRVSNTCKVIVYEPGSKNNPGDIDHDGAISAEDALQVLKHTVGIASLDENSMQAADLNADNVVNAEDALLMMKIAVGSL